MSDRRRPEDDRRVSWTTDRDPAAYAIEAAELIDSEAMVDLLKSLRARYHHIVMDGFGMWLVARRVARREALNPFRFFERLFR